MELVKTTAIVCIFAVNDVCRCCSLDGEKLDYPIESVSSHLRVLAEGEGDLTSKIDIQTNDETGTLSNWFNQFIESTRALILGIKKSSVQIDKIAAETSSKASDVAKRRQINCSLLS